MSGAVDKDSVSRLIVLVRGIVNGGGFYWCYVAVKPTLIDKFQKAIAAKYNIQNFIKDAYGEVVVSGKGRTPPKEVTDKVAEIFNIPAESLKEMDDPATDIAKVLAEVQTPKP